MRLAEPVLTAADISVELGSLPVLRRVSLSVGAGEAVALLGGNGSGKSTLVRSMMGLVPVSRGSVELFGTPLGQFTDWSKVGYVPQRSTGGLSGAKVKEVVASGRLAHRRPFVPAGRRHRQSVRGALDAVGLLERADDELAHLSGGQQQRVLIARALAGSPSLLVLDEPIAGVDLEHQHVLAALLSTLLRAGTAVLVVLHEIGALAPLVHRAVVLREGRVVHDGELGEVTGAHPHHGHEVEPHLDLGFLEGTVER
ncbi:MAG TPA: ATP-binding cassette domain-containing protein [Propionibacteriaceae bacterium]|nr:ATP-binding cassette domain-containing protein [Propionibacteriaceae bacterium]